MVITSKTNPKIKDIKKLQEKKYRRESGLYLVEGTKPVAECIKAGCKILTTVATVSNEAEFPDALIVSDTVFKFLSTEQTPQGVLAVVEMPQVIVSEPLSRCLLLDGVSDPGNLGTIIRTANAAGYNDLYLLNCADAYSPKTVRASMSGIFFVRLHQGTFSQIKRALDGIPLICADMNGENIFSFYPPEKFCLCVGNEGNGISEKVFELAEHTVKIPMSETCESLNVAISAGIAMYALKNNLMR